MNIELGGCWLNGDTGFLVRAVWPLRLRRSLVVTVAVRGEQAVPLTSQIMSSKMGFVSFVRTGFTKMVSGKPQDLVNTKKSTECALLRSGDFCAVDGKEPSEGSKLGRDVYFRIAILAVVFRWTAEEHEMGAGR